MSDPGSTIRRKVIIDTDLSLGEAGSEIDDGIALALAAASDPLEVIAVTTVNGNTHVETATLLTRRLLDRLGLTEVPVFAGARDPLLRPRHQTQPPALSPQELLEFETIRASGESAAAAIVRLVRAHPGEITLVAIGPLTNIALAIQLDPGIVDLVAELYVMGGYYFGQTNRSVMTGEFNAWADPVGFDAVLTSGIEPRLVGLDVTRRVDFPRARAERMAAGTGMAHLIGFYALAWIERLQAMQPNRTTPIDASYLHDPLVIAAVLDDDLITWRPAYVRAEAFSPITRGVTIADLLKDAQPPAANALVAVDVNVERFASLWDDVFPDAR